MAIFGNLGRESVFGLHKALVSRTAFLGHRDAVAFCTLTKLLNYLLLIECVSLCKQEVFVNEILGECQRTHGSRKLVILIIY